MNIEREGAGVKDGGQMVVSILSQCSKRKRSKVSNGVGLRLKEAGALCSFFLFCLAQKRKKNDKMG
jgi:hypothetical protein